MVGLSCDIVFHPPHTHTYTRAAFTTKTVRVDDNSILFQIWDTAGQEKVTHNLGH